MPALQAMLRGEEGAAGLLAGPDKSYKAELVNCLLLLALPQHVLDEAFAGGGEEEEEEEVVVVEEEE